MKRLNFYWRTVLSITMAILLTLVLVGGASFISNRYVKRMIAAQTFQNDYEQILANLQENGIQENFLQDEPFMQHEIVIFTKDKAIVYPNYYEQPVSYFASSDDSSTSVPEQAAEIVVFSGELITATVPVDEIAVMDAPNTTIAVMNRPGVYNEVSFPSTEAQERFLKDFYRQTEFTYDGVPYTLEMYNMYARMPDETGTIAVLTMLPYYAVGGIIVALGISILYANYYTKKMLTISEQVTAMRGMETIQTPERAEGDELTELANNIYDMYDAMQDAMLQLDTEMQYTKKLEEEKQIFMRGATHELKTPIMTMSVMLEGMLANFGDYQDHEVYLQKSLATLQVMEKLVNEILSVSKLEQIKFGGSTKVQPVIDEVLAMQEAIIEERGLEITTAFLLEDVSLPLDAKSVSKVFSNIIGNAIHYSPEDSELFITVASDKIIVQNTTHSKQEYTLEQLKEPFVTNDTVGGHGLGLYIVDMLLARHQIKYAYTIEDDQFIFTIYL